MKNGKTTIAGIAMILGGVINFLAKVLSGGAVDMESMSILLAAVSGGIGLIKAADSTP